jgi:SAM-dependent methyltransferase
MLLPVTCQSEYWNGPAAQRWIAARGPIDRSLASIQDTIFGFASPAAGEAVLDVGCGCGTTTWALYGRTGARVLGLDISAPMVGVARASQRPGVPVEFRLGDAGSVALDPEFDLVFSRFGVMFFADPVAAFRHLRRALLVRGRIAFACWQATEHNTWATAPLAAARPLLPPQEPVDPHAPGPFAFSDRERLRGILEAAGLRDIDIRAHATTMYLGASVPEAVEHAVMVGPLARVASELPATVWPELRVRLTDALARYATADAVELPAAVWLVGAR